MWFIITYLRSCFTLFHYFTLKSKVWVAYPYGMVYRKKANSRILFGIINKHTRGKIGIEKIGKGSTVSLNLQASQNGIGLALNF